MPKQPKGHATKTKSKDSRRNGSRIAISPSIIKKLDSIALRQSKSRADIVEELINKEYTMSSKEYSRNQFKVFKTKTPFEIHRDWTVEPDSYTEVVFDEENTYYVAELMPTPRANLDIEFQECTTGDWCEDDYTLLRVEEDVIVFVTK